MNESALTINKPIFYSKLELAPSVNDPRRLVFVVPTGAPKPPDEILLLRQDYERTARVAAVLFEDEPATRIEIFKLMHEAADRLRGSNWNIDDGQANLVEVRENILDYAHKIRSKLLTKYTTLLVVFGAIPLILGVAVLLTGGFGLLNRPAIGRTYDPLFVWILAACWIPAGAAICIWGVLRMRAGLSCDQLLNMDPNPSRWQPGQRLLVTVGVSFIFAFLLAYNAVQVGIGIRNEDARHGFGCRRNHRPSLCCGARHYLSHQTRREMTPVGWSCGRVSEYL